MKKSNERMECSHHGFCCQNDNFRGCQNCKEFEYRRVDWLHKAIEENYGVIVPYNYTIVFDPSISRFIVGVP